MTDQAKQVALEAARAYVRNRRWALDLDADRDLPDQLACAPLAGPAPRVLSPRREWIAKSSSLPNRPGLHEGTGPFLCRHQRSADLRERHRRPVRAGRDDAVDDHAEGAQGQRGEALAVDHEAPGMRTAQLAPLNRQTKGTPGHSGSRARTSPASK